MRRYYLSPIIGDGSFENPYRAKIQDFLGVNTSVIMPTDGQGVPSSSWALVFAGAANHTPVLADIDIKALPDLSLDATLGVLSQSSLRDLQANLDTLGIPLRVKATDSFRSVLRSLGQQLISTFDENNFNVSDA